MNIHNKIGTKKRFFEMFENVNKVNINENSMESTLSNNVYDVNNLLKSLGVPVQGMKFGEKDGVVNVRTQYRRGEGSRLSKEVQDRLRQQFGEVHEDMYEDDDRGISWHYKIAFGNSNVGIGEASYSDLSKTSGNDNPSFGSIRYNYDQNGNWIPEGYEDKKIGLRALEKPMGSDNWVVAVVQLDHNGDIDSIITEKNNWDDAKSALHGSIT